MFVYDFLFVCMPTRKRSTHLERRNTWNTIKKKKPYHCRESECDVRTPPRIVLYDKRLYFYNARAFIVRHDLASYKTQSLLVVCNYLLKINVKNKYGYYVQFSNYIQISFSSVCLLLFSTLIQATTAAETKSQTYFIISVLSV